MMARGRDGRQDRSRSPAGRFPRQTGHRGRSPVRPAIKKDTKCFNCGMNNHTVDVCRNPCGMCGARDHKAKMCKMNPKSPNYIPPFKRQNPRAPTTKAHAKVVVATLKMMSMKQEMKLKPSKSWEGKSSSFMVLSCSTAKVLRRKVLVS
jgi:hypothetical protein